LALLNQFFLRGHRWKQGVPAGQTPFPHPSEPVQGLRYPPVKSTVSAASPTKEVLRHLLFKAFALLNLSMSLVAMHQHTPVGSSLRLFVSNWERLHFDPGHSSRVPALFVPLASSQINPYKLQIQRGRECC